MSFEKVINHENFIEGHWEKKPFFLKGLLATDLLERIDLTCFDNFFSSNTFNSQDIKVTKNGNYTPPHYYCNKVYTSSDSGREMVDINKLFHLFEKGNSILIPSAHNSFPEINTLCIELEKLLNHSVSANLYISPEGSNGFLPHYDNHDVFALQLSGKKRWRITESGVSLPITSNKNPNEGALLLDQTLTKNDILYIPRGFTHEVFTEDEASIHVTFSVATKRIVSVAKEIISEMLDNLADTNIQLRKTTSIKVQDSYTDVLKNEVLTIIESLNKPDIIEQYLENYLIKEVSNRKFSLEGHFESMLNFNDITSGTNLIQRKEFPFKIKESEKFWYLFFKNKFLKFDYKFYNIFKQIMPKVEFKISELRDEELTEEEKLSFTKTLVKNCFIYRDKK